MRKVIFLGPSLTLDEAKAVCPDAIYLPPAAQSDLLSAVGRFKPDIIGLIDGVFLQDLSVWHKEILYALTQGVVVIGASSMGALRAAETARYGTLGAGEIYRRYADGTLTDDDEVALVHGPAESGYRKFSEPMVNVRATFAQAVGQGVIAAEALPKLLAAAKAIHFTGRTWPAVFAALPGDVAGLKQFVASSYVDQKKLDALALLRMAEDIASGARPKPEPVPFEFNVTTMFSALYHRDRTVESEGTVLPLYEIAEHAALHHPEFPAINEAALDRSLVGVLADLTAVEIADDALEQEAARFRKERGIEGEAEFAAWLGANHLDRHAFDELMLRLAKRRRLHLWLLSHRAKEKNTLSLLDQLRIRGDYAETAADAALHRHLSAGPLPEDAADTLQLARDHVHETGISMRGLLADWSFLAGFHDLDDLRVALLRSKAARAAMREMLDSMGE